MNLESIRAEFAKLLPPGTGNARRQKLWLFFLAGYELSHDGHVSKAIAESCVRPPVKLPCGEVWAHWQRLQQRFGNKPDAWLRLARIAAAGDEGVTHAELFPQTNGWKWISKYSNAGLLEVRRIPLPKGRPLCRIVITHKALWMLSLDSALASSWTGKGEA